jgi:hypothetical protein
MFRFVAVLMSALLSASSFAQATPQPAQLFAGNWSADANFTSTLQSNPNGNYFWIGKTWGQINPSGKFRFLAENGCEINGLLAPYLSAMSAVAKITSCANSPMNGIYSGYVSGTRPTISITFSSNNSLTGKFDQFAIKGTFTLY